MSWGSTAHTNAQCSGMKHAHRRGILYVCKKPTLKKEGPPRVSHRHFPHIFFPNAEQKRNGVLIVIRDTVSFAQSFVECDPRGSYIIWGTAINNHKFTIVNLYASNTHQKGFLSKVINKAKRWQYGNLLVCGDFNDVADPTLDSSNKKRRGGQICPQRLTLIRCVAMQTWWGKEITLSFLMPIWHTHESTWF